MRRQAMLVVALVMAACGSDDDETTMTRGEVCTIMAEAHCDRRIECGGVSEQNRTTCINDNAAACCGALCASETEMHAADLDACVAAYGDVDCVTAVKPDECPVFE